MCTRYFPGLVLALLLPLALGAQTHDDFDGSTLKPFWSWTREQSDHWSISEGYLEIITQSGALNTKEYNNVRNVLLQDVPDEPIVLIETRVLFDPSYWYHNAGLIYRIDDDNYVRVSRGIYPDVNGVWMEWEIDGETFFHFVEPVPEIDVLLRLSRTNDTVFTATYSVEPGYWHAIGTENIRFPQGRAMAGLQAANGEGLAALGDEIPAQFDYFGMKPTAVHELPVPPADVSLLSAHPMPCRPGALLQVGMRLDRTAEVQWFVTDLLGRRVLAPQSTGQLAPGAHTITVSLRDVSPGVYFLHATAGRSRAMRRILLTR
jgi:hypothetical protein